MMRCLAVFLLCFMPLQAMAQTLPEPLSHTVSDYANLLSDAAEARVTDALAKGRQETGVHVVLVTMGRIEDHGGAGQRIEDYAKALFNQWGVGDADRKDGILVLVARNDRNIRIALGGGYDVIWDNAAQRVIDRHFLPAFREDRYADDIEAGVAATFTLIAAPFAAGVEMAPPPPPAGQDFTSLAVFAILAAGVVAVFFQSRIGAMLARAKPCPNCGKHKVSRSRTVVQAATTTLGGHGTVHSHCAGCGWDRAEPFNIPRTADDPPTSEGFGGGSSSGGGASGRW